MLSQTTGSLVAMTEMGLANEMGSGKVRWRAVQESLKGALVSGTGSNVTSLAVSSDSEWLAYGRRNVGVFVLKLQGGSGTEVALPMTNSGLGGVVSAIHLSKTGSGKSSTYVLYAGDLNGNLVSWHFKDEHSLVANAQPISTELGAITGIVSHKGNVFVAVKEGTKVSTIAIASGRSLEDFPPCASPPIRGLNVAHHVNALVVTTQHRHLSVYSLLESKSVQYLAGEGAPLRVDVSPHLFEQEYQHILGVSELGELSIWKINAAASSKKPIQPVTRVKLDNASAKGHLILSASFSHSKPGSVIVAYGTLAKPVFTELSYWDESTGSCTPKLSINSSERNALLETSTPGKDSVTKASKEDKGRLVGSMDGVVAHATFKGANEAMQVDYPQDAAEIPFGQLVKQQSKTNKNSASSSAIASSSSAANTTASSSSGKKSAIDLPRATSAVAALVAALSTNDRAQLSLILSKHDDQFITSTLRQLPVSQVLPLLTELLSSFAAKASLPIISWTRHLLIIHQSYLASAPDLINKLSGLYNTVDERLKNFPELLKLSGRFDLLLAHLRHDEAGETHVKRALQTYVEEDDDLPDYDDEEEEESGEGNSDEDLSGSDEDDVETGSDDYDDSE